MQKLIKRIIMFLLIISVVIISSCDRIDNKLKLLNDTKKNYFFIVKEDTFLQMKDVDYIDEEPRFNVAKANDTSVPLFAFKNHGGYIRKINEECLDSTMFLYLFEMDSVKKYSWSSIIKNDRMFIRKRFKVKDLDSAKWLIKISSL